MRIAVAIAICAAFVVAGCQTQNAYTGEQQTSDATHGAVRGATGGATVGPLTNTSHGNQAARNALIGAGVGALVGASIGGYLDEEEADLRHRLRAAGVSIARQGDKIVLNMESDITFDSDSDQVQPQFYQVLAALGEVLTHYNRTILEVSGHTDSKGPAEHNKELSQRRANAVADVLVHKGVMPQRMNVEGFGESHPVSSNATSAGRKANRRVEVQIIPLTS